MNDIPLVISLIVGSVFLFVSIGIAISDIRMMRLQKSLRQHPHARKWRQRPTIAVVHRDTVTSESLVAIEKGSYRKIIRDTSSSDLLLRIPQAAILEHTAIMDAVRHFNDQPSTQTVEPLPLLTSFPNTITGLFAAHHYMLNAPFAAMRAGYRLVPLSSIYPIVGRQTTHATAKTYIYDSCRRILHSIHAVLLAYIVYITLTTSQSTLLLVYITGFSLWAIWSIGRYPRLSFAQKICYFILLPTSGIYLAYRLVTAPLRFAPRQFPRQNATIEI